MKKFLILLLIFPVYAGLFSQEIPAIYSGIKKDNTGKFYIEKNGEKYYEKISETKIKLTNMLGNPSVTGNGISFYFGDDYFNGTLYYGLINYNDSKHPAPVFFKRNSKIEKGKAEVDIIKNLSGIYDMTDWEKSGKGTLGYRVVAENGKIMYDGIISFFYKNLKFKIAPTIIEGPFISKLKDTELSISFKTNVDIKTSVKIKNKTFYDIQKIKKHEIKISGLEPDTKYEYEVNYADFKQNYTFKTAPETGKRTEFVFGYASDSRAGAGGGERDIYGTNAYIMKKISALGGQQNVAFLQFTGDLINGYSSNKDNINLQYANWKHSMQAFVAHYPIIPTIGNHEVVGKIFVDKNGKQKAFIPNFPFETESGEAIFADNFCNPENGLQSEDNAIYDPDKNRMNFPSYKENVFYYTYDNIAMIVLNSNYWYTPSLKKNTATSGNLHAYIMDNQLKWLEKIIAKFEKDDNIDHVFISQHTPAFPNGGHVKDDMWYNGNNKYRAIVAGKPVEKGIIERRDEYLDILINKSSKVAAMLTGDEHNYNKVRISPEVNIYPENYTFDKLKRKRTIWQINNGAAGAPYYAQDKSTPWTNAVSGFSTQNALVLIYVNGKKVSCKVMNPDTLELIDEFVIAEK